MQDFAGKTALVTGGSSGTGKATAQQLAGRGAPMILSGRDKARGDAAAAESRSAGG
jgi:NAD(P)-dependent dehydrogenase (short-subunit alcohol dehydrogenase family)